MSNYSSINRDLQFSSRVSQNQYEIPQFERSRFVETNHYEQSLAPQGSNILVNVPLYHECDSLNHRSVIPDAQTILQETLQTDQANILSAIQYGEIPANVQQKSQGEFLTMKLSQMKEKHKQLQQQLSDVSKFESISSKKKNITHSQSSQGFYKGGAVTGVQQQQQTLGGFNFGNVTNQIKQMDVISNILSNIKFKPNQNQQKDIEVIIEKNDLYRILKVLIDQLVAVTEKLNAVASERDIVVIQNTHLVKEMNEYKERIRLQEEELKISKGALTETKIELERQITLYDLLERKYLDLLKKKQEVKIINKETYKEIVVEKPIEVIKQVNNLKIVKQKKEVRKVIRPKPDVRTIIEKKLHILEKETVRPEIQIIEKVREIPKVEFVDKEKIIEKPFFVERQVDRFVEVPKYINKEVIVDRPVYIDRPIEKIVKVPQIIEKEKLVDRPIFIEKPVDRIIEKETFVDRPVYIQEPPVHIDRVVEVPKIVEREKIINRPVYIQNPPIERRVEVPTIIEKNKYIEKPVYINRSVYEPVSSQLVHSLSSPMVSTQLNSPAAYFRGMSAKQNSYIPRYSPFSSTYSPSILSPQYIPQQIS